MSVTEKLMAPGQFSVQLDKTKVPNSIINQIDAWGHIVIVPADVNVQEFNDSSLLDQSDYTGIVYSLEIGDEQNVVITGQGLVAYLGDSDSRGMPIAETGGPTGVRSYTNTTLENVLDTTGTPKGLLRDESGNQGPIRKGNITDPGANYTGKHYTESALKAIKYVCQELGVEFKVNQKGLLDAGPVGNLFAGHTSDPTSIIVRGQTGEDPNITGLTTSSLVAQFDASEFVNKVELVASKYGAEANYGSATASSNPYKDLFGTALKRTQYVSDPQTPNTSKNTRATAYLNELNLVKKTLNVSLDEYDISGDFEVGDKIFIFDPDIGFVDTEADRLADSRSSLFETVYQGRILNPTKIRILGITWPIKNGYGVFYRKSNGTYLELTDYLLFETGDVQLEVGDVAPTISESLGFSGYTLDQVGTNDKTVPNAPSNLTQVAGTYTDGNGVSKAFIKLSWTQPTNSDGSTIIDGSIYRIRFKAKADSLSNNITDSTGTQVTDYQFQSVTFGTTEFVIYDLSPNTFYEVGVQTIDQSGFDSSFTTISSVQTPRDGSAPNKPAGFSTIASNPLRVQFIHKLGQAKNDAGNAVSPVVDFTLAKDIDHLNIYASTTSGFNLAYNSTTKKVVNSSFKIGELKASHAHITNGIPTIGYIDLDNATTHFFRLTAVDSSGNESEPSDEQSGNADLVDTAHIANLAVTEALIANAAITNAKIATAAIGTANIQDAAITNAKINDLNATKINAGTISADRIASGSIDTSKLNFTPVSGSNVVATINASSEGITIDADTLDLSGVLNVGDAINIGGSDSTSFHVDSDGNMFLGAGTLGAAPFKVTNAGVVTATSYTLTGGNINTATVTNPAITLSKNTASDVPTTASSDRLKIGDTVLFNRDISGTNYLTTTKSFLVLPDGDEDNPSIAIQGTNATMGFFVNDPLSGVTQMQLTNGDDNVASWSTADDSFSVPNKLTLGGTLQAGGGTGNSGQVLASTGSGVEWISTSGHSHGNLSFPNSGTVLSTNNHNHSGFLTNNNHSHINVLTNNNHSHGNTITPNNHNHNFNADITGFNHTNEVGHHTHNFTVAEDPHGNSEHNASFATNAQVNSAIAVHNAVHHSDIRLKEDVQPITLGLDFVETLKPVDYKWKSSYLDSSIEDNNIENSWKKNRIDVLSNVQQGFIAQDLQKAVYDYTGSNNALGAVYKKNYTDKEQRDYKDDELGHVDMQQLVPVLVKSIQQLSAKIKVLEAQVDELGGV
tara:strand:+ start:3072 stop:6797 length:3726 start_codon:yes stop_codon:yes gene_type:complete